MISPNDHNSSARPSISRPEPEGAAENESHVPTPGHGKGFKPLPGQVFRRGLFSAFAVEPDDVGHRRVFVS